MARPEKVDIDKAIELRLKGLSYPDIAKHFNCHYSAVIKRIGHLLPKDIDVEAFKKHRADLLAGKQAELLSSLTPDEIKKIPPGSRATAFGIFYDKERLERGESTSNVAYADLSSSLASLREKRKALESELGISVGDESINDGDVF